MSYLLLGAGLLLLGYLVFNWATTAHPRRILESGKWVFAGLGLAILLLLLVTGRFSLIWAALIGVLPWVNRLLMLRNVFAGLKGMGAGFKGGGRKGGGRSSVSTRFFEMTLDHDSGEMDGDVREGRFVGRRLSDLDEGERLDLAREVAAADAQSMRVLETYLDRTHGPDWRRQFGGDDGDRAGRYQGGFGGGGFGGGEGPGRGPSDGSDAGGSGEGVPGAMSRAEALGILGLSDGASESDIRAAHRRLMKLVHPDVGGSDALARRVNEAKRVLLGK
ncbi:hypothetical protein KAJ83_11030 [Marivibrio halodurans]|uniref:J domain-containing protein n=1 Tax=Marivibrio halodurans TaxID=2039722 RepID=A0A8J7S6B1_9PROT|nr:hypothetical protein [Marivibrio halodurans]MBP5857544.1 hypothetical protein [Marivibrio halodurans]